MGRMANINGATSAAVRRALKDRGLSQAAAGAAIGMSQPALNDRLAGRTPWRLDELDEMADLLAVPLGALLVGIHAEAVAP